MFKDLKEYQEITRIYNESVNISEEQRTVNKLFNEEDFTPEELDYLEENFDTIWDNLEFSEEQIQEAAGLKLLAKGALKLGSKISRGLRKANVGLVKGLKKGSKVGKSIKDTASATASSTKKVAGNTLKKVTNFAKKAAPTLAGGAVGGAVGGGIVASAMGGKNKKKTEDQDLKKKIDKGIKDSGMKVGQGTAMTMQGIKDASYNRGVKAGADKVKAQAEKSKAGEAGAQALKNKTTKTKKMNPIETKNRARFGDEKVDKLKSKQVDFKKMRKGEMSKADFIKKYPKSITAQKEAGLRDHAEWDAYDMVLEYLFSTEQVTSLEEANYVMLEMDQQTIGEIVKEVKGFLEEGLSKAVAKGALKLGGLAAGAYGVKKTAEKLGTMSGTPKEPKKKKDGLIKKLKDRRDATNKAIEQM